MMATATNFAERNPDVFVPSCGREWEVFTYRLHTKPRRLRVSLMSSKDEVEE